MAIALVTLLCAPAIFAQNGQNTRVLSADEILKRITYPPEFEATVFASPPNISYPVFLSAAPDGTLFVGCDMNGSLDQQRNRGRIVMCQDTNRDGRADVFTDFAVVDCPRGVAWDASRRALYVVRPPKLTVYYDDHNRGVANREEDLITGLGPDLSWRGGDHTINGIRLGIDGWLYIAAGDYGMVKATGKDGRSLSMRGGGIIRVRPDGTGLEQVSSGMRNILAVAVSPTLDLFTRDNTNDGDDWNVRLSFVPFGAQMGYPSLFRNFADEIIQPMIDFGGGSPVGSIFIDEPALPKEWAHGFYSVEWGRSEIDLHPLTQDGAGWKAATKRFMTMPRATDLEVDGAGRLYVASWEGAMYTYAGPNVGYVVRLAPKGTAPAAAPDFKKLTDTQLVEHIGSPSGVWRLAAQRELLARGWKPGQENGLQQIASGNGNIAPRVAALFTLKQLLGPQAHPFLITCLNDAALREYALKALADDTRAAANIPSAPFITALNDPNPRVRLQAVTALGRLGKSDAASALFPRVADSDPVVAHVAVQSLRWLGASDVCFRALDSTDEKVLTGALRVLQAVYEPAVVEGLLARLSTARTPLRHGIFKTLCRLAYKEAPFTDPRMWWGTRPDTSGPIYKAERWAMTDRIEAALKQRLTDAQGEEAKFIIAALLRAKVSFPGLTDLMLAKAGGDTASFLDVIGAMLSSRTPVSDELIRAIGRIATSTSETPDVRTRALRVLCSGLDRNFTAAVDAFLPLALAEQSGLLASAWEEFTRDPRLARRVMDFARLSRDADPARRTLGATVLVNLVGSTIINDRRAKTTAERAIERLWQNPAQAASLLVAIGRTRSTQFEPQVRERLNHENSEVAAAAKLAFSQLGLSAPDSQAAKKISELPYDEVVRIATTVKGDAKAGEQLFLKQSCIVCHTMSEHEKPKGPMLGGIAARYSRAELIESIIRPSAKIAQGFATQVITTKQGDEYEGFVVKEGGDSLEVRSILGASAIVEKADVVKREKREQSVMPTSMVDTLTPEELASMLAYLESTTK